MRPLGSAGLVAAAILAWVAGLVVFSNSLLSPGDFATSPASKAIIVLTGGKGRLEAAFKLLENNPDARLLISGVGAGVRFQDLGARAQSFADRIDLGRAATDTFGNARESRKWAQGLGIHRTLLVTGSAHMPRSLLAFENLAPDLEAIPYPVPDRDEDDLREAKIEPLIALATEYTKYLLASGYFAFGGAR